MVFPDRNSQRRRFSWLKASQALMGFPRNEASLENPGSMKRFSASHGWKGALSIEVSDRPVQKMDSGSLPRAGFFLSIYRYEQNGRDLVPELSGGSAASPTVRDIGCRFG